MLKMLHGLSKFIVLFSCLIAGLARAQVTTTSVEPEEMTLFFERSEQRSHFLLGSEFVQVASKTGELMGFGPRAGFEYSMTDTWSLGTNLSFEFQASTKAGAFFYSGINGFISYSFLGTSRKVFRTITKKDGTPVFSSKPQANRRLAGFLGMEQLFLNGLASIYPAVGPTVGIKYGFRAFGQEAEVDFRYSSLLANDNPLSMMALGGHINLDF